ncbi:MAG: hypothetical protein R3Y64_06740 [Peptostreptococcaceae bacterium]
MENILFFIYLIIGYWAVTDVVYANKIVIESQFGQLFMIKCFLALSFGWFFIPIAFIKASLMNKFSE